MIFTDIDVDPSFNVIKAGSDKTHFYTLSSHLSYTYFLSVILSLYEFVAEMTNIFYFLDNIGQNREEVLFNHC